MIKRLRTIWKVLLSLLFALAVFLLCLFPYRALLNYHEQTHLFRWNGYYFREQCQSLDGCLEYLVSWITQFFYIGWIGAALVALLSVLIQWLSWKLLKLVRRL